ELVGAPARSVAEVVVEGRARLHEIARAARASGLVLLGGGLQPFARTRDFAAMPKERYRVLERHLARRGGVDMMRKTQSLQVSLDWEDEADLVRLARAAHAS